MKDISGQLELKYIKAKNLKISDHVLFRSHSVDWVFGSLVVAIIFLLFRWLVPFLFTVFIENFLLDLTGLSFRRTHYSTVFDCDCKTSRDLCCVRSGVRNLCFIGRRHDSVDRRFDKV